MSKGGRGGRGGQGVEGGPEQEGKGRVTGGVKEMEKVMVNLSFVSRTGGQQACVNKLAINQCFFHTCCNLAAWDSPAHSCKGPPPSGLVPGCPSHHRLPPLIRIFVPHLDVLSSTVTWRHASQCMHAHRMYQAG